MTLGRSDPCHPVEGSGRTEDLEARSGVGMFSEDRTDLPERPPLNSLRIWEDVGTGIDRNQTVEARSFVEKYMKPVISILLDQQPSKIGQTEKNCVEESLKRAVAIVAMDLDARTTDSCNCNTLDVLAMIFNKKRSYYKGSKPTWNVSLNGAPEVRTRMIHKFRLVGGFQALAVYLENRVDSSDHERFPSTENLHLLLQAVADIMPLNLSSGSGDAKRRTDDVVRAWEDTIVRLGDAVMCFMGKTSEEGLKKQTNDIFIKIRFDLQVLFDKIAPNRREDAFRFYEFWRKLSLRLITSQSLPLRLLGWEQVGDLIEASADMRPPPKYIVVEGAGRLFVNGRYIFAGPIDDNGYARIGEEAQYRFEIPKTVPALDGGGKMLTVFRCTMRSQQKWWFLSEADDDQPGTDKDIDYYQHKSRVQEDSVPPSTGWVTCRSAGVDPPPSLRGIGLMVPLGQECNTLEHQLARWAIEEEIVELVLGDSVHREVVSRSQPLMKFLASMCERDENYVDCDGDRMQPNAHCLTSAHLLLAWKTCTSRADAAVSTEVYHLLVSMLPLLPDALAVYLLRTVQQSMHNTSKSNERHDCLPEVAEFCCALSAGAVCDNDNVGISTSGNTPNPSLSDLVRTEILKLLWEVLTHPGALALKSYEQLKNYVSHELRVEPHGTGQRENSFNFCRETLLLNSRSAGDRCTDESFALQIVKLTRFLLEACPRAYAVKLVSADEAALPSLLFQEFCAYMRRRASAASSPSLSRKTNAFGDSNHWTALVERLSILRFAYGLSENVFISFDQLELLWELCSRPSDREAVMMFLACASNACVVGENWIVEKQIRSEDFDESQRRLFQSQIAGKEPLKAAFSNEVLRTAFENLVCASTLDWDILGPAAYQSFKSLFNVSLRYKSSSSAVREHDINAMWRIFLSSGNSDVALSAMRDLLHFYVVESSPANASLSFETSENANGEAADFAIANQSGQLSPHRSNVEKGKKFVKRIFECLLEVKCGLETGDVRSQRAVERCLTILNAGIGQSDAKRKEFLSEPSLVVALPDFTSVKRLSDAMQLVPHGMRGQGSYRSISAVSRRAPVSHSAVARGCSTASSCADGDKLQPSNVTSCLPSVFRFSLMLHPLETLASVKGKVGKRCNHPTAHVKLFSVDGRQINFGTKAEASVGHDSTSFAVTAVPDDATIAQLGVREGGEVVFLLAVHPVETSSCSANVMPKNNTGVDLSKVFASDEVSHELFFDTLLAVLNALPASKNESQAVEMVEASATLSKLVWDLLLAMPSNREILDQVQSVISVQKELKKAVESESMEVGAPQKSPEWSQFWNGSCSHRSVYTLQIVDFLLRPAPEILSSFSDATRGMLLREMMVDAAAFRIGFIDSGGFEAVLRLFTQGRKDIDCLPYCRRNRRGDGVSLRVLNCCFVGNSADTIHEHSVVIDNPGKSLLESLRQPQEFLFSLAEVVVADDGVSDSAILDSLYLIRVLLTLKGNCIELFVGLPNQMAERYVTSLLLRKPQEIISTVTLKAGERVRKSAQCLVLTCLRHCSLPWHISALGKIEFTYEWTEEFFNVIKEIVEGSTKDACDESKWPQETCHMQELGRMTCARLAAHPRPRSGIAIFWSTEVLCGCLRILRALIEFGGTALVEGALLLVNATGTEPWSNSGAQSHQDVGFRSLTPVRGSNTAALIDLMGAVFDGFLLSSEAACAPPICCDSNSREIGFAVLASAARACEGPVGYIFLVTRLQDIISAVAPSLRHRWGVNAQDGPHRAKTNTNKYSGLRNQGCTCYMNSLLQQLFMMPDLRKNLCSAPIPLCLRTVGGGVSSKGMGLVGKKISLQWENGRSYEALVEKFDPITAMHTVRYHPLPQISRGQLAGSGIATVCRNVPSPYNSTFKFDEIVCFPDDVLDEFVLLDGRPGKETGIFEVLPVEQAQGFLPGDANTEALSNERASKKRCEIEESEEETASRRLLEEIQRTFVHLEEGLRGRCFDPRSLVEASCCLKLEFDVWQQNDASEYAMKLLDRLEVVLKKWAPEHFVYLSNTFGLKQTKQKFCKECGLKTNREENHMTIDCQIRGKASIHEALEAACEVEYMEGDNKISCDRCGKKTDSVLRTAISALPDVLVLSLKRFDLDYTTFETVKLNSRCAFGQILNMKKYTLEGVETAERARDSRCSNYNANGLFNDSHVAGGSAIVTDCCDDHFDSFPDEDYEFKLAGVLVHAGVAQGGHYYSYIRDRMPAEGEGADKWYRFDDDDVTAFDPELIEAECFGGKVKKETKWPNGQVHFVESEQFANALMLFYEKVVPNQRCIVTDDEHKVDYSMDYLRRTTHSSGVSGYSVFQPDVRKSNATHNWHKFLFDKVFQTFLKGLLKYALEASQRETDTDEMEVCPPSHPSFTSCNTLKAWTLAIFQASVSYLFDVVLHSSDRDHFESWVFLISDNFEQNPYFSKWLTHELARRSCEVSRNWMRAFCTDCPDEAARLAGLKVIALAVRSTMQFSSERDALSKWSLAWKSQRDSYYLSMTAPSTTVTFLPARLEGKYGYLEAIEGLEKGSSSSIGILFSCIASSFQLSFRNWRTNCDIPFLVCELIGRPYDQNGEEIRRALVIQETTCRLACLSIRDRAPHKLKAAFPGESAPLELTDMVSRNENTPSAHMNSTRGIGGPAAQSVDAIMPTANDYINLMEAIGCLIGVGFVRRAPLTVEIDEQNGRILRLTKAAREALTAVFREYMSHNTCSMGEKEIHRYMVDCGVSTKFLPGQKISSILDKYSGPDGSCKNGQRSLGLEGFLAYYRDAATAKESQLLNDLNTLGFRPDLSRRALELRILSSNSTRHRIEDFFECVALDVDSVFRSKPPEEFGPLSQIAIDSFQLHGHNAIFSESTAAYIVAASSCGRDSSKLITDALQVFRRTAMGTSARDALTSFIVYMQLFKVLASLPDDRQQERIETMMQSVDKSMSHAESRIGLLVAAKELSASKGMSTDFQQISAVDRYIEVTKALYTLPKVAQWMQERRDFWIWMEQWGQARNVISSRQDVAVQLPLSHMNQYSDIELNAGFGNDSDDDDEDRRYESCEFSRSVEVHAAGVRAVNGTYCITGAVDSVARYTKEGIWKSRREVFSLYRCQLNDQSRKWFISIVPQNSEPGTDKDVDFYWAAASEEKSKLRSETPPKQGWSVAKHFGLLPVPVVSLATTLLGEDEVLGGGHDNSWNGEEEGIDRSHPNSRHVV